MRAAAWIAYRLRRFADEIDRPGAPKTTSYSFTFEEGEGIRFRDDGKGCPLWYLNDAEYERAHGESDTAARKRAERSAPPLSIWDVMGRAMSHAASSSLVSPPTLEQIGYSAEDAHRLRRELADEVEEATE